MANQQLSDYVRQQLQQGKNKDEIKDELLGAGWPEADIDQTLGSSSSKQPPKPPTSSATSEFTPTGPQQLDPKSVWSFFLRWFFTFLIIMWFIGGNLLFALLFERILWSVVLVFLFAIVFAFIWAKLTYHFYRYELTEEGFRKEFGVIIKKYVTIPYERIQNVNIHRGVLDRILGISALKIFTAGSGGGGKVGSEGLLPGLSANTAEELRTQLVHLSRQNRGQGF